LKLRLIFVRLLLTLTVILTQSTESAFAIDSQESNTAILPTETFTANVLPPKMVNPLKAKAINVKLGIVVVFSVKDPEIWKGKVVDRTIAKFVPGGPQSTYETNPSLALLKKGKTVVSLTDGRKTYFLKLTVS
jgi:hypothetical protein